MYPTRRGQSEVLGAVLILGITMAVVGSTVAIGSVAFADSRSTAELQKAEIGMTQVDSAVSLVAHGDATSRHVDPGLGGPARTTDDGVMTIEVEPEDDPANATEIDVEMNALVYEHDGTTVAYQGGGVWRSDGDHSRMVSPPEFHYRGETLTLPLVTLSSGDRLENGFRVRSSGPPDRRFPTEDAGNPLVGGNVTITVESTYAGAWEEFFETRTEAEVTRVDDDEVEASLPTKRDGSEVTESAVGLNVDTSFVIDGVHYLFAEAYDSRDGPPSESAREGVVVHSADEIDGTATGQLDQLTVRGDLLTSGDLRPNERAIDRAGNISVTGELMEYATVERPPDLSGEIDRRHATIDDAGPNDPDTYDVSLSDGASKRIDGHASIPDDAVVENATLELVADGETYVDFGGDLTVTGDGGPAEVVVDTDTAADELHLRLDGDLDVDADDAPATITVAGDGELYVYGDGDVEFEAEEATAGVHVTGDDATVQWYHRGGDVSLNADEGAAPVEIGTVDDARTADRFWLVTSSDDVALTGDDENEDAAVYVNGVLYATDGGDANLEIDGLATVDGALVADDADLNDAELTLRYDEAIGSGLDPFADRRISTVNHLHVSVQDVTVDDD